MFDGNICKYIHIYIYIVCVCVCLCQYYYEYLKFCCKNLLIVTWAVVSSISAKLKPLTFRSMVPRSLRLPYMARVRMGWGSGGGCHIPRISICSQGRASCLARSGDSLAPVHCRQLVALNSYLSSSSACEFQVVSGVAKGSVLLVHT